MKLNETIRFYRKQLNMTQEEMAAALGVSAPAVNKWEKGSSCPDISLLAPLARLLDISLDTLLSYEHMISNQDIENMIHELSERLKFHPFDETWKWMIQKIHIYPNCDSLLWQMTSLIDSYRITHEEINTNEIENQIHQWYKRLIKSTDESIRFYAANSLFHFYLKQKKFIQAEETLSCLSAENPLRKQNQALLARQSGNIQEACKHYEELLFQYVQLISSALSSLNTIAIEQQDFETARYLTEKMRSSANLFEMGEFHELSSQIELSDSLHDIENMSVLLNQMIDKADTISAFTASKLYQHMSFKKTDPQYIHEIKQSLTSALHEIS